MAEDSNKTVTPGLKVDADQVRLVVPSTHAPLSQPIKSSVAPAQCEALGPWYKQTKVWLFQALSWDACAILLPIITPWTPWKFSPVFGVLFGLCYGIIAFGMLGGFMKHALSNLEMRKGSNLSYQPSDGILCWLLPVLNLWVPYQIMLQIWCGSKLNDVEGRPAASDVRRILRWWLPTTIGYVGCWIPLLAAFFWSSAAGNNLMLFPAASTTALIYWSIFFCFRLFAAVQLNGILKEITHWQMHKLGTDPTQMMQ